MGFPDNILDALVPAMQEVSDPEVTLLRPLRMSDPNGVVGIYMVDTTPTGQVQIGQREPVLNNHNLRIQTLVKSASEEEARRLHTTMAKMVRVMLYRDAGLALRLAGLTETLAGTKERFQMMTVGQQRYLNNEISRQFLYLSTTSVTVQTEIVVL